MARWRDIFFFFKIVGMWGPLVQSDLQKTLIYIKTAAFIQGLQKKKQGFAKDCLLFACLSACYSCNPKLFSSSGAGAEKLRRGSDHAGQKCEIGRSDMKLPL